MSVGIHRRQNRTAGSSDSDLKVGSLTDLNRYFQLTKTHFPTLTGLDFFSFSTALRIFMLSSLVIVIVKSSLFIFSLVCFFVVLSLTKASPPAGCWLLRRLAAIIAVTEAQSHEIQLIACRRDPPNVAEHLHLPPTLQGGKRRRDGDVVTRGVV